VPVYEDKEQSFDELRALIAKTLRLSVASTTRRISTAARSAKSFCVPARRRKSASAETSYLLSYGLPQFSFMSPRRMRCCATTAWNRQRDYMGAY